MQRSTPGPGYLVAQRYRLLDTVGQGGMGVVWRAKDEVLGRTVAVKQLLIAPTLPDHERDILRERVLREARAAARLQDPAAVTVYDVVTDGDSPYIVMELVDASSLAEVVRDDGPLPPARVARIGLAVLGALEAAHAAGIMHRDVKPGNVMVCANGRVLLTDFGISSTQGDSSITQTGLLLGSPAYIAPERAQGGPGGPESDLWALGATLYTAVEGTPAYDADGALATLSAVVDGRRRPAVRAGALRPVLNAMLATDPHDRPLAGQIRRMLEDVLREDAGLQAGPDAASAEDVTRAIPRVVAPPIRPPVPAPVREQTAVYAPLPTSFADDIYPPQTSAEYADDDRLPFFDGADPPARRRRRTPRVALVLLVLLVLAGIAGGILAATGVFQRGSGTAALGGGSVPAGWVADAEGPYTIYHPADWTRQSVPGNGSAYGLSSTLYERVALVSPPGDPLATVKAIDAAKVAAKQPGYRLLGITDNGGGEADIQWVETDGSTQYQLLERAFLHDNRLYTLLFFARADTWARALPYFQAISGTFRPTG